MSFPYVVSVVLNTNRRNDTLDCLGSLDRNTYPNMDVIVVDNLSADGSVQAIREAFPRTRVVELDQNFGYAGNNNVGIRLAVEQGADWIFVLNEDTLAAPDCVERLVATGEADSQIGMVGPTIYHFDEPGTIQAAGGMMDKRWTSYLLGWNEEDVGQFSAPHAVDWLSGCSILARRGVVEQIGGFDERFFIYFEETDWCIRARAKRWRLVQVPQAKLWHKGVRRNYQPSPAVTYYSTRNKFLLMAKHHAPVAAFAYHAVQTLWILMSWSLKPSWRSKLPHRDAMLYGVQDFLMQRWGMKAL